MSPIPGLSLRLCFQFFLHIMMFIIMFLWLGLFFVKVSLPFRVLDNWFGKLVFNLAVVLGTTVKFMKTCLAQTLGLDMVAVVTSTWGVPAFVGTVRESMDVYGDGCPRALRLCQVTLLAVLQVRVRRSACRSGRGACAVERPSRAHLAMMVSIPSTIAPITALQLSSFYMPLAFGLKVTFVPDACR